MDYENHRLIQRVQVNTNSGSTLLSRAGDHLKRIYIACNIKPSRVWINSTFLSLNCIGDQHIVAIKENVYRLDLFEEDKDLPLFIPALCFEELSLIFQFPTNDVGEITIGYLFQLGISPNSRINLAKPFMKYTKCQGKNSYLSYANGLVCHQVFGDVSIPSSPFRHTHQPNPDDINIPFMNEEKLHQQYKDYDSIFKLSPMIKPARKFD